MLYKTILLLASVVFFSLPRVLVYNYITFFCCKIKWGMSEKFILRLIYKTVLLKIN